MKRRQHVGKKRAKVSWSRKSRRKSRRDTVKGVARIAHESGVAAVVEIELTPEERRMLQLTERVDDLEHRVHELEAIQALVERDVFKAATAAQIKKFPRLDRGTAVICDTLVVDLDGDVWMIRPSIGYMTKGVMMVNASRAERRREAARNRTKGQPEITKHGVRHLTTTCAGCFFWDTTDPAVAPGRGVCREDSPQLVSVQAPIGTSQNGLILQALWPVTAFDATCGKHMAPTGIGR